MPYNSVGSGLPAVTIQPLSELRVTVTSLLMNMLCGTIAENFSSVLKSTKVLDSKFSVDK